MKVSKPLTEEQFNNILFKNNIIMKEQYNNQYDLMLFECTKCKHQWKGRMIKVRTYKCCPECRKKFTESPYGNDLPVKERNYIKNRARQLLLLEKMGGICNECKCDLINEPWKSEYHHIEPLKKEYNISSLLNNGIKHLEYELDKCILLCSNCHRKKHFDLEKYNYYKTNIENITKKLKSGEITMDQGHKPASDV